MTSGRNLEPSKFGVKPGTDRPIQPSGKPDQFGQVPQSDKDFSAGNVPSAHQSVKEHARSDVDASRKSQHHTLGNSQNQSAPGNHIHDGVNGRKMGPMEMDPGNPGKTRPALTMAATAADIRIFLHNFFEFRDV